MCVYILSKFFRCDNSKSTLCIRKRWICTKTPRGLIDGFRTQSLRLNYCGLFLCYCVHKENTSNSVDILHNIYSYIAHTRQNTTTNKFLLLYICCHFTKIIFFQVLFSPFVKHQQKHSNCIRLQNGKDNLIYDHIKVPVWNYWSLEATYLLDFI